MTIHLDQEQDTGANDIVKAVDQLLNEMGPKFAKVSSEIFERSASLIFRHGALQSETDHVLVDEMSRRLDEMEAAIQAGNDTKNTGS